MIQSYFVFIVIPLFILSLVCLKYNYKNGLMFSGILLSIMAMIVAYEGIQFQTGTNTTKNYTYMNFTSIEVINDTITSNLTLVVTESPKQISMIRNDEKSFTQISLLERLLLSVFIFIYGVSISSIAILGKQD